MTSKTYSELCQYKTFEDRYKYLKLHGEVGHNIFGSDRHINQRFYKSFEWLRVRDHVILRDNGCDLGIPDYEIYGHLLIHHINPIVLDDIIHGNESIIDPEFLITTTQRTHNAIHFGDDKLLPRVVTSRKPYDTKLW